MHSVSSVLVLHMRAVASSEPVTSMEPSSESAITLTLSSWSARVSFSVPALFWCEAAAPILATFCGTPLVCVAFEVRFAGP